MSDVAPQSADAYDRELVVLPDYDLGDTKDDDTHDSHLRPPETPDASSASALEHAARLLAAFSEDEEQEDVVDFSPPAESPRKLMKKSFSLEVEAALVTRTAESVIHAADIDDHRLSENSKGGISEIPSFAHR